MNSHVDTLSASFRNSLSITRSVVSALLEGSSVVISGPRHFLCDQIASQAVAEAFEETSNRRFVRLSAAHGNPDGALDFESISNETRKQLKISSKKKCLTASDFVGQMTSYFKDCKPSLTIFLLRSGDRTHARLFRELIDAIHQLVDYPDNDDVVAERIFVAVDDYSLHYLIQDSEMLRSEWFRARWLQFEHLTKAQVTEFCLTSFDVEGPVQKNALAQFADRLYEYTDGHIGLLDEFFEQCGALRKNPVALLTENATEEAKSIFSRSKIMERIRAAISDDSTGLCATAVGHVTPMMPSEYRSPRIQMLRQLGILRWDSAYEARMCRGVVGEMVSALAGQDRKARLGTVTGMAGISRFEGGEFSPSDSDIVVVHISDLHFGEDFGYKLDVRGRAINESQADITTLLESDIRSQNLQGRIDAIVISGDVACSGTSPEYCRALDVLTGLANALNVKKEHIVVVPGNHDLQWNPGEFSRREGGRNVSREGFDNFVSSLCGKPPASSDMLQLVSRDGKTGLRIVTIDSNEVEGPESGGIGFVGEDCLRAARQLISNSTFPDSILSVRTWFVMHHHISAVTSAPLADAKRRGVSVMANTPSLLAVVREMGVEAVLHGHEHQPAVTEMRWWLGERTSEFGTVAAICAGSLSAKRERLGPVSKNQYMVLIRRPMELVVRSRVVGEEGLAFRSHEDLSLMFSKSQGKKMSSQ